MLGDDGLTRLRTKPPDEFRSPRTSPTNLRFIFLEPAIGRLVGSRSGPNCGLSSALNRKAERRAWRSPMSSVLGLYVDNENSSFSRRLEQLSGSANRGVDHLHGRTGTPCSARIAAKIVLEIDQKQGRVFRRDTGSEVRHQGPEGLDGWSACLVGRTISKLVAMRNGEAANGVSEGTRSFAPDADATNPVRVQ